VGSVVHVESIVASLLALSLVSSSVWEPDGQVSHACFIALDSITLVVPIWCGVCVCVGGKMETMCAVCVCVRRGERVIAGAARD